MSWRVAGDLNDAERSAFASQEVTLSHEGALINESKTNFTRKVQIEGCYYYVKRYLRRGKYLRRYLGRSRVKREWLNAAWLRAQGIPTPRPIAFGEGLRGTDDYWGVIVCEEVKGTLDLRRIYHEKPELLAKTAWRRAVIGRLADVVLAMHQRGFIHNDLQWRNILAELGDSPEVYIIDCPAGRKVMVPGNRRGVVRDLAFLDKMAGLALSRTDRLRFFLRYAGARQLNEKFKQEIRRILMFFSEKTEQ